MRTGIAFRPELAPWLASRPAQVKCLEFTVDQAVSSTSPGWVRRFREWPMTIHAPRLSLGTPGPLDASELGRVVRAATTVDALWISAYLGHRHRPEPELSYPLPLHPSRATLGAAIANCRQLAEASSTPVLVENVAAFGRCADSICPARFLNTLCDETGCRVLLDVTALAVDARFGFEPSTWLWDVNPSHIAAMHLGGWANGGRGRWAGRREGPISEEAWTLARDVAARTPVTTTVLQREGRSACSGELQSDLARVAALTRVPTLRDPWREPAFAMAVRAVGRP